MNKYVLSLPDIYGGLFHMALQISAYIPKSKYYIEPFSGLARTAKYARSQIIILNDKAIGANKKCEKIYPNAIITNYDFEECIKKYDSKETFFLIDPPWRLDFYNGDIVKDEIIKNNLRNKKAVNLSITDRSVKEYFDQLQKILPKIKGHYILTLSLKIKFQSPYEKILRHIKPHLFGFHPSSHLYSNKPLKIQIPQISDYI